MSYLCVKASKVLENFNISSHCLVTVNFIMIHVVEWQQIQIIQKLNVEIQYFVFNHCLSFSVLIY